jgi:hypothetical protein
MRAMGIRDKPIAKADRYRIYAFNPRSRARKLSPLDITREICFMGRWILITALLALLAGALFGAYQGWTAHSGDVEVPPWALTGRESLILLIGWWTRLR